MDQNEDLLHEINEAFRIAINKKLNATFRKNGYIIESESDLYELYATHISHICNKEGKVL